MAKNTIVISAFPGKGKTYQYLNQNKYKIVDSDSSKYSWIYENGVKTEKRNPNFVNDYISAIKEIIDKEDTDVIFVSSHSDIRKALEDNKIKYFLVYGYYNEKNLYLNLYRNRGNSEKFIQRMDDNYYNFIENMDKEQYPYKIKLHASEFITEELLDVLMNYNTIWNSSTREYLLSDLTSKNPKMLNWTKICQFYSLPTSIMEEYSQYLDYDTLYMYQKVPEKFAKNHIVNINYMLKYQKFSKEFKSKLKDMRKHI